MAELWHPQPIEVYQAWCIALRDEASEKLTLWESDFLDSIEGRLAFRNNLTKSQAETLEKIYAEKTK